MPDVDTSGLSSEEDVDRRLFAELDGLTPAQSVDRLKSTVRALHKRNRALRADAANNITKASSIIERLRLENESQAIRINQLQGRVASLQRIAESEPRPAHAVIESTRAAIAAVDSVFESSQTRTIENQPRTRVPGIPIELSVDTVVRLKRAFDRLDVDGSGELSKHDLQSSNFSVAGRRVDPAVFDDTPYVAFFTLLQHWWPNVPSSSLHSFYAEVRRTDAFSRLQAASAAERRSQHMLNSHRRAIDRSARKLKTAIQRAVVSTMARSVGGRAVGASSLAAGGATEDDMLGGLTLAAGRTPWGGGGGRSRSPTPARAASAGAGAPAGADRARSPSPAAQRVMGIAREVATAAVLEVDARVAEMTAVMAGREVLWRTMLQWRQTLVDKYRWLSGQYKLEYRAALATSGGGQRGMGTAAGIARRPRLVTASLSPSLKAQLGAGGAQTPSESSVIGGRNSRVANAIVRAGGRNPVAVAAVSTHEFEDWDNIRASRGVSAPARPRTAQPIPATRVRVSDVDDMSPSRRTQAPLRPAVTNRGRGAGAALAPSATRSARASGDADIGGSGLLSPFELDDVPLPAVRVPTVTVGTQTRPSKGTIQVPTSVAQKLDTATARQQAAMIDIAATLRGLQNLANGAAPGAAAAAGSPTAAARARRPPRAGATATDSAASPKAVIARGAASQVPLRGSKPDGGRTGSASAPAAAAAADVSGGGGGEGDKEAVGEGGGHVSFSFQGDAFATLLGELHARVAAMQTASAAALEARDSTILELRRQAAAFATRARSGDIKIRRLTSAEGRRAASASGARGGVEDAAKRGKVENADAAQVRRDSSGVAPGAAGAEVGAAGGGVARRSDGDADEALEVREAGASVASLDSQPVDVPSDFDSAEDNDMPSLPLNPVVSVGVCTELSVPFGADAPVLVSAPHPRTYIADTASHPHSAASTRPSSASANVVASAVAAAAAAVSPFPADDTASSQAALHDAVTLLQASVNNPSPPPPPPRFEVGVQCELPPAPPMSRSVSAGSAEAPQMSRSRRGSTAHSIPDMLAAVLRRASEPLTSAASVGSAAPHTATSAAVGGSLDDLTVVGTMHASTIVDNDASGDSISERRPSQRGVAGELVTRGAVAAADATRSAVPSRPSSAGRPRRPTSASSIQGPPSASPSVLASVPVAQLLEAIMAKIAGGSAPTPGEGGGRAGGAASGVDAIRSQLDDMISLLATATTTEVHSAAALQLGVLEGDSDGAAALRDAVALSHAGVEAVRESVASAAGTAQIQTPSGTGVRSPLSASGSRARSDSGSAQRGRTSDSRSADGDSPSQSTIAKPLAATTVAAARSIPLPQLVEAFNRGSSVAISGVRASVGCAVLLEAVRADWVKEAADLISTVRDESVAARAAAAEARGEGGSPTADQAVVALLCSRFDDALSALASLSVAVAGAEAGPGGPSSVDEALQLIDAADAALRAAASAPSTITGARMRILTEAARLGRQKLIALEIAAPLLEDLRQQEAAAATADMAVAAARLVAEIENVQNSLATGGAEATVALARLSTAVGTFRGAAGQGHQYDQRGGSTVRSAAGPGASGTEAMRASGSAHSLVPSPFGSASREESGVLMSLESPRSAPVQVFTGKPPPVEIDDDMESVGASSFHGSVVSRRSRRPDVRGGPPGLRNRQQRRGSAQGSVRNGRRRSIQSNFSRRSAANSLAASPAASHMGLPNFGTISPEPVQTLPVGVQTDLVPELAALSVWEASALPLSDLRLRLASGQSVVKPTAGRLGRDARSRLLSPGGGDGRDSSVASSGGGEGGALGPTGAGWSKVRKKILKVALPNGPTGKGKGSVPAPALGGSAVGRRAGAHVPEGSKVRIQLPEELQPTARKALRSAAALQRAGSMSDDAALQLVGMLSAIKDRALQRKSSQAASFYGAQNFSPVSEPSPIPEEDEAEDIDAIDKMIDMLSPDSNLRNKRWALDIRRKASEGAVNTEVAEWITRTYSVTDGEEEARAATAGRVPAPVGRRGTSVSFDVLRRRSVKYRDGDRSVRFGDVSSAKDSQPGTAVAESSPSAAASPTARGGAEVAEKGTDTKASSAASPVGTAVSAAPAASTAASTAKAPPPAAPVVEWPARRKLRPRRAVEVEVPLVELSGVDSWDFNVYSVVEKSAGKLIISPDEGPRIEKEVMVGHHILTHMAVNVFNAHGLFEQFEVDVEMFTAFMVALEEGYKRHNPYHNNLHAADVLHGTHALLLMSGAATALSPLEVMAILFAAAVHDYQHPGVNNAFLVNALHRVALRYNENSVLEAHHVSAAFALENTLGLNWLSCLPSPSLRKFRKIVTDLVLATDMSVHFSNLDTFRTRIAAGVSLYEKESDRLLLMRSLLHAADISNPARPIDIYMQWTHRVQEEFWAQGRAELALGLPLSPLCNPDLSKANIPAGQVGFISFIIKPTFSALTDLFGDKFSAVQQHIERNFSYWQKDATRANEKFLDEHLSVLERHASVLLDTSVCAFPYRSVDNYADSDELYFWPLCDSCLRRPSNATVHQSVQTDGLGPTGKNGRDRARSAMLLSPSIGSSDFGDRSAFTTEFGIVECRKCEEREKAEAAEKEAAGDAAVADGGAAPPPDDPKGGSAGSDGAPSVAETSDFEDLETRIGRLLNEPVDEGVRVRSASVGTPPGATPPAPGFDLPKPATAITPVAITAPSSGVNSSAASQLLDLHHRGITRPSTNTSGVLSPGAKQDERGVAPDVRKVLVAVRRLMAILAREVMHHVAEEVMAAVPTLDRLGVGGGGRSAPRTVSGRGVGGGDRIRGGSLSLPKLSGGRDDVSVSEEAEGAVTNALDVGEGITKPPATVQQLLLRVSKSIQTRHLASLDAMARQLRDFSTGLLASIGGGKGGYDEAVWGAMSPPGGSAGSPGAWTTDWLGVHDTLEASTRSFGSPRSGKGEAGALASPFSVAGPPSKGGAAAGGVKRVAPATRWVHQVLPLGSPEAVLAAIASAAPQPGGVAAVVEAVSLHLWLCPTDVSVRRYSYKVCECPLSDLTAVTAEVATGLTTILGSSSSGSVYMLNFEPTPLAHAVEPAPLAAPLISPQALKAPFVVAQAAASASPARLLRDLKVWWEALGPDDNGRVSKDALLALCEAPALAPLFGGREHRAAAVIARLAEAGSHSVTYEQYVAVVLHLSRRS